MNNYKLGSLFDGSGGFPLAGALCGIEPVWAAEVEPYPIAVTRSRFPSMKHLGDISKVSGAEIEPVDIITFGSPCQDLSVAGKRAGLKHEANGDEETTRSGLFMEAVRIIKEMRKATNGRYPTFALWENVPGAFSSNNGEDFRIVCEELIKIVEPSAVMPPVPKGGWNYADSYVGDGWSLAYRVLDAQYWGVPQRRRRIYLVADFRGERAREVLFEREGLRGYFTQGTTPWQTTPADAQGSLGADDREGERAGEESRLGVGGVPERGGTSGGDRGRGLDAVTLEPGIASREGGHIYEGVSGTLRANAGDNQMTVAFKAFTFCPETGGNDPSRSISFSEELSPTLRTGATPSCVYSVENHPADSRVNLDESGKVQTLTSRMGTGGGNVPMVMEPFVKSSRAKSADDATTWKEGHVANTLNTFDQGEARTNELVVMATQQGGAEIRTDGKAPTLTAAAGMSGNNQPVICLQGNGIDRADTAGCNGRGWSEDTCYTLNTVDRPAVAYGVTTKGNGDAFMSKERHTALTGGGGQAGQGYPCVAYGLDRAAFNQGQNAKFDFSVQEEQQPTLTARGPGAVAYGIDHAITTGGNCTAQGSCVYANIQGTLKASGAHAVCYSIDEKCGNTYTWENQANTLAARDYKQPQGVAYAMQGFGDYKQTEQASACKARDYKDATDLVIQPPRYIVRRLTPTECARLQGFADWWGWIEEKKTLTDEEYRFWCDVFLTKALIDGTVVYNEDGDLVYKNRRIPYRHKTEKQMLTWYNKLWTDSAEYKMWGNGIALPTALYCVQGVAEALARPTENKVQWSKFGECPVNMTEEQFDAIYNDDTDDDDWMN